MPAEYVMGAGIYSLDLSIRNKYRYRWDGHGDMTWPVGCCDTEFRTESLPIGYRDYMWSSAIQDKWLRVPGGSGGPTCLYCLSATNLPITTDPVSWTSDINFRAGYATDVPSPVITDHYCDAYLPCEGPPVINYPLRLTQTPLDGHASTTIELYTTGTPWQIFANIVVQVDFDDGSYWQYTAYEQGPYDIMPDSEGEHIEITAAVPFTASNISTGSDTSSDEAHDATAGVSAFIYVTKTYWDCWTESEITLE